MSGIKNMVFFVLFIATVQSVHALKLTRAIVSSDTNPTYVEFWPIVARAWKQVVGIQPTLLLVAPQDFVVDETVGDVIRFEPIPGVPTGLQAQLIRLFLPAFFPDDGCILSDIDMIPLNKDFFVHSVASHTDDTFISFKKGSDLWYKPNVRVTICYNAAKGSTFAEIFDIKTWDNVRERIVELYALGLGWGTDELMLAKYLYTWNLKTHRYINLDFPDMQWRAIDRADYARYLPELLREKYYIDAHVLRPYSKYKEYIDGLLECAGVKI